MTAGSPSRCRSTGSSTYGGSVGVNRTSGCSPPRSTGLGILADRGSGPEEHVIPAGQALARLVAAGRLGRSGTPRAEHGERRHGRDLLGMVVVVLERRARSGAHQ